VEYGRLLGRISLCRQVPWTDGTARCQGDPEVEGTNSSSGWCSRTDVGRPSNKSDMDYVPCAHPMLRIDRPPPVCLVAFSVAKFHYYRIRL
jgi:hypothetical protein